MYRDNREIREIRISVNVTRTWYERGKNAARCDCSTEQQATETIGFFFWASWEFHQYDESRPRSAKRTWEKVSDFCWLKPRLLLSLVPCPQYLIWTNPAALADSWSDIGPLLVCWLQLSLFLKKWGPFPQLLCLWFASETRLLIRRTCASDPWPSAHG